jgi:pseudo-rSAM protein
LNGEVIESLNADVVQLVEHMISGSNLPVFGLKQDFIKKNREISDFISAVRNTFMGDLVDTSLCPQKPAQIPPYINIQEDIDKFRKGSHVEPGKEVMKYLHDITFYINDYCELDCGICSSSYKQFLSCHKTSQRNMELDFKYIEKTISAANTFGVGQLNISGGNIFFYSEFAKLCDLLNRFPINVSLYLNYLNVTHSEDKLKSITGLPFNLNILLNSPVKEKELEKVISLIGKSTLHGIYNFIVAKEEDIEISQQLISRYGIKNYYFKPYFNGGNIEFFRANVFPTREDIIGSRPTMKEIFKKQKVNLFNFGSIIISSSGSIRAAINAEEIGNIKKNSLQETIYKEITGLESWRKTRERVEPCKNCNYNLLCPSISNYEFIIGKNNLCSIR